jgi:hypothetical protein
VAVAWGHCTCNLGCQLAASLQKGSSRGQGCSQEPRGAEEGVGSWHCLHKQSTVGAVLVLRCVTCCSAQGCDAGHDAAATVCCWQGCSEHALLLLLLLLRLGGQQLLQAVPGTWQQAGQHAALGTAGSRHCTHSRHLPVLGCGGHHTGSSRCCRQGQLTCCWCCWPCWWCDQWWRDPSGCAASCRRAVLSSSPRHGAWPTGCVGPS